MDSLGLVLGLVSIINSIYNLFYSRRSLCPIKDIKLNHFPSVSVNIAVKDPDIYRLINTIDSIKRQRYNGSLEIIIVYDGRIGQLSKLLRGTGVKLIEGENKGKARALNKALRESTGEIIVILDEDNALINENSIEELVKPILSGYIASIGRLKVICNGETSVSKAYAKFTDFTFSKLFKGFSCSGKNVYIIGGGSAILRKALLKVGGWSNKCITEDLDLSVKLISNGYKISYSEKALIASHPPSNLFAYISQISRWALGAGQVLRNNLFKGRGWRLYSMQWLLQPMIIYSALIFSILSLILHYDLLDQYYYLELMLYFIINGLMYGRASPEEGGLSVISSLIAPTFFLIGLLSRKSKWTPTGSYSKNKKVTIYLLLVNYLLIVISTSELALGYIFSSMFLYFIALSMLYVTLFF